MVRASFFIFGYRVIEVAADDMKNAVSLLLRHEIPATTIPCGKIFVGEEHFVELCNIFEGKIEYTAGELLGIPGFIKRLKFKRGLALGAVVSVFIMLFLGNLVWDIRIDGNNRLSQIEVKKIMADCGFDVGCFWPLVDRSKIETDFLASSEELAWININRKGTVAYIEVIETDVNILGDDNNTAREGYANVIAAEACVIEEITVKRGVPMVKVGDAVKAGDILISGVLSDGFCYAEGDVVGRLSDTVCVDISRSYEKNISLNDIIIEFTIKIFNFPINIFKKYGNSIQECDIIEDVKVFSLFSGEPLPFSIIKRSAHSYKTETAEYSDEELVDVAFARLQALTLYKLRNADLLKIKTYGDFSDSGYFAYSDVVYLSEIGKTLEFKAD